MMFTQEDRLMSISTPLGADVLLLTGFSGREEISRMFSYSLELVSEDNDIAPMDIIGKNVTVKVALEDGRTRYINGVIAQFTQTRVGGEDEQVLQNSTYAATLVPWLWFANRGVNSRIYQGKDVKQIVEQVCTRWESKDYRMDGLTGEYQPREYCVQYRETDFNFICRLLEEEGIYFYFAHEDGKHTLVLADNPQEHKPCPVQDVVRCQLSGGATVLTEGVITGMGWNQEVRFGKYTLKDYNYLTPATDLKVEVGEQQRSGPDEREYYLYPARYTTRSEGERLVNLRMQAEEARVKTMHGVSNCRTFASGYRFNLQEHPRADLNGKPYVITSVTHQARQPIGGSGEDTPGTYTNRFTCIPADVPFRPPLNTPRPVVAGVQTAVVTGPQSEEIYTDEHGRVKVRFHWDREDNKNEESSCWARVAQLWAGQGWGGVWIPRIGHEVIVSFVDGDPDRPLVMGSVYNAHQTPPYKLPDNATQSGIKSHSSKGGTADNFNEFRFEDKKGAEQIVMHAEKDMDTSVEANDSLDVGGDRKVHVKGHFTEKIDGGEERTVMAGAKETISGGMQQTIDGGEKRTVIGGITETVNGGVTETILGSETRTVNGGQTETVTGAVTQTVAGPLTHNVSGPVTINTPVFNLIAPSKTGLEGDWFQTGMKSGAAYAIAIAMTGMKTEYCGISNSFNGVSITNTGLKLEHSGANMPDSGVDLSKSGMKLWQHGLSILTCGLYSVS